MLIEEIIVTQNQYDVTASMITNHKEELEDITCIHYRRNIVQHLSHPQYRHH